MKKLLSVITAAFLFSSCGCNKDNENDSTVSSDVKNDTPAIEETIQEGDEFPIAKGKNRVIYELNTGSFTTEGTFKAAGEKLQDLKDVGVDIVWLMPIYPRGGGINSPYAATDFKDVNPKYGKISDLKDFVSKAHTLGMEVWLDWVPNHTATDAKWVTSNPDYYKKKNGEMVHPNNYGDVFQLNYSNPDLAEAMTNCLKFWIDEADIDGYRCDYVSSPEIPASYWAKAIPEVKNYKSGKTITFLAEGDLTDANNSGLVSTGFEYDYAWGFQEGGLYKTVGKGISGTSLQKVCEKMLDATEKIKPIIRMIYLTNHDQNYNDGGHLISDIYGENVYPFTALIFTFKGMPLLYNGQEIGGKQILDYFNDTKIKWNDRDEKMYNIIKNLAQLKHSTNALAEDATIVVNKTDNSQVFAYTRGSGKNAVITVINLGTSDATVSVSGLTSGVYTSKYTGGESIEKVSENVSETQSFTISKKGFMVLSK